ncbi:MAG: MMPL family transporter [Gammaproteobacteria bacterium]|nr:MMPL family transporter [Gammaproteobacteria bacterium]
MAGDVVSRSLTRLASLCARRPRSAMAILVASSIVVAIFAAATFRIDSDTENLIRQDTDWRRDFDAFQAALPMLVDTALVVVSGSSFEAVDRSAADLAAALRRDEDVITAVFAPASDPLLRDRLLYYLSPDELDDVITELAMAQPAMARLAADPSLRGLFGLLSAGIGARDPDSGLPATLLPLLEDVSASAADVADGGRGSLRWMDRMLGADAVGIHYAIITVRGEIDFEASLPYGPIMNSLRTAIESTDLPPDVRVRLTGEVPLAHEEVEAATDGIGLAGTLALILLAAVLVFGVRSGRVVLATFAMLAMGFAWTIGWGMLAVGQFTTLSIIFLVMFFGLGVDFAIHYALRVQEALARPDEQAAPEAAAANHVGGAIALCTLTSSIGFLAYLATDYRGLAELGAISAGGMVIALLLTFTVIPACFGLFGRPRALAVAGRIAGSASPPGSRLTSNARWVFAATAVFALLAAWQASHMRFDYSVLALRNPDAESMVTLAELKSAGEFTDYSLSVLARPEEADDLAERLRRLPSVALVQTPDDAVPEEQETKRFLLDDALAMLGPTLQETDQAQPTTDDDRLDSSQALRAAITTALTEGRLPPAQQSLLQNLDDRLGAILEAPDRRELLSRLETGTTGTLPELMDWLQRALGAAPFDFDELPAGLRERLITHDGRHHLVVLPADDISEVHALNRFIEEVRDVAPHATGRPVAEWGVGRIVVDAFAQALVTALLLIFLVLVVTLRSLRDALLVLTPLLLAALFTVASAQWLGMSFNMANILVLPLLFGLGVDNGVHLVKRYRSEGELTSLMRSSTPRAVLLSSLTTAGTFAALSLSPHQGTASIGMLLTIAIGWLLLTTLVLLPLLLERFASAPASDRPG